MTEQLSRRNFLAGAGVLAASAAALGMAGCASPKVEGQGEKATVDTTAVAAGAGAGAGIDWADEADVVVIGFGGSGSIAGITAVTQGASVIVLEKDMNRSGGNLARSSGTLHDSCGCDVEEWVRLYEHGTLRCGAPEDEIRKVLTVAADAESWVGDYNLTFTFEDQETAGTTWPAFQREGQAEGKGAGLFAEINAEAERVGLDVRTSTPVKRLIQDPTSKEILGVVAEDSHGNEIAIKARKGVIMACGGYELNADMFFNYNLPGIDLTATAHANPYNTGDGFPMAQEVGAQLWHMNEFHFGGLGFPQASRETGTPVEAGRGTLGGGGKQGPECDHPWIIVDRNGKRFMNESYIWAHDQNHKEAFDFSTAAAFSKATFGAFSPQVMKYTDVVSQYIHLPMFIIFGQEMFDGDAVLEQCKSNEEALEKGWIWKGATLEELAAQMTGEAPSGFEEDNVAGLDAAALKETLATWNSYAAAGADPEFLRPAEHVLAIPEEGPFYAAEVTWTLDFTEGGPKRNGDCQTISVRDEVIPRLYNTGEFGSFNSTVYCIGGVLQALTTGRIAGMHAANLDPWEE